MKLSRAPDRDDDKRRDDRHGTFAGEEAEIRRELDSVEPVESQAATMRPTMMPPKTPVSIDGMPMIGRVDAAQFRAHAHRGEEDNISRLCRRERQRRRYRSGQWQHRWRRAMADWQRSRSPDAAMICDTIVGSHEKLALPTPSRMPATGNTDTGSIMHLPIFCSSEKAFLNDGIFIS